MQDIWAHEAVSYIRRKLPSIIKEKHELQLHKFVQDTDPIRTYWNKVQRASKLLKLPKEMANDHFYKGLSAECSEDLDRIDPDLSATKIVDILEKIEKRRDSKQQLGFRVRDLQNKYGNITPVQVSPITSQQEPAELRRVASQAIAQEQIDKLISAQTDKITKGIQDQIQAFQLQIQALQDKISKPAPHEIRGLKGRRAHEFYENLNHPEDDYDRESAHEYLFEMMEKPPQDYRPNRQTLELAQAIAKASAKARKARMDRQVDKLADVFGNMDLGDEDITANLADIILQDADGNEYTTCMTRGSKKK